MSRFWSRNLPKGKKPMGITTSRSPWSHERTGPSPETRIGRSRQSSGGNRVDSYGWPSHGGKDCATRRDMPTVEPPRDGNRVVEPVARDRR
jgi:hypothetical protein